MITLALFLAQAFATNSTFQPVALYAATFILDLVLFDLIDNWKDNE